jgi:hypothetical protein
MIELIANLPDNVVAFTASGQVSGDDYNTVIIPAVESAFGQSDKIRLLYHIGPAFKKFTTTALWDDARVGFHHLTGFERIAVVTDVGWIQSMARGVGVAMAGQLRVFADAELEQARAWIVE